MTDPIKRHVTHKELIARAQGVNDYLQRSLSRRPKVYPIPRGGIPATYLLAMVGDIDIVDNPLDADFFFDDIIDSGATRDRYREKYKRDTLALIDKTKGQFPDYWIVFPWETADGKDDSVIDNIKRILQFVGEDAEREGLQETPARVAKAWESWCAGYGQNPADVLKVFEDGSEGYDEMVVVKDIPFYSHCEHHMAPFFGTATIAYIPDGKIVGLSKLSRLLDVFAHRLQVQERLTFQIAEAIMNGLNPKGCGVVIKARHMCMESRGVCKQGHHTVTSALRGAMREEPETRAEFLLLSRDNGHG